jgi:hypothetical protein
VLNTYINYLVKTQSFKQIAFSGTVGPDVLNAISDPLYPLVVPEGATAAVLDLNTQLAAIDQVIKGKVMAIANNYGISSENFSVTGTLASGYALKIANRSLEEIRTADREVARRVEDQLFVLTRLINNLEYPEPIPEELALDWDPGEIEYPASQAEEQGHWNFEFDNGISNAIDYLIEENPDLTREEAMVKLEMIRDENKKLKPEPSVLETVFGQGGKPNPF